MNAKAFGGSNGSFGQDGSAIWRDGLSVSIQHDGYPFL